MSASGPTIITIPKEQSEQRLDRWLRKQCPAISFAQANKWIRTGQVRVDGKRAKPDHRLASGQNVRLPPFALEASKERAEPNSFSALSAKERDHFTAMILYEDQDCVVLNKPAGLAVQGGSRLTTHIDGIMRAYYGDKADPKLVHRLDKETSGVLVIAKHGLAAARLSAAFRDDQCQKTYWALVHEAKPSGKQSGAIDAPLMKQATPKGEQMVVDRLHGKPSLSTYERLHHQDGISLMALHPMTGRTHQLRVHCAERFGGIVGDRKYGQSSQLHAHTPLPKHLQRMLFLHAKRLTFPDPATGRLFSIEAPLPCLFKDALEKLDFSS